MWKTLSGTQDELAGAAAGKQVFVGAASIREGVLRAHHRAQPPGGDELQQLGQRLGEHAGPGEGGAEPEADDREVALHQAGRLDRGGRLAGRGTKRDPPTASRMTSTRLPLLASTTRSVYPPAAPSTATSAPRSSASFCLSGLEAVAMTRPAPKIFASCTASEPTPPAAALTTTVSPGWSCALVRSRCHADRPCTRMASAAPSSMPSGTSIERAAGASAFSAYPPEPVRAITRRPSAARPITSLPGTSGSSTTSSTSGPP